MICYDNWREQEREQFCMSFGSAPAVFHECTDELVPFYHRGIVNEVEASRL